MDVLNRKIENQANLRRIFIFAPLMALYLTTEFLRDLRKFFLPRYALKFFEVGSFSVHAYLLFVILDGLFVVSSLAMFLLSFSAAKKLKNGHWNDFYYKVVQIYGIFLTVCAFLAVIITARVFGVADFTFAFIIIVFTSSILYINSRLTIAIDSVFFIISFVLINYNHMAFTYNPYWAYIIVFMLISTATAYIKERHLQDVIKREKTRAMFLANMSHEIRTPMNAIIGMSELAMDFDVGDKEKNIIRQIHSSGINLIGIINDILDFSKIESGKMEIVPVKYDLVKLMNDIMNVTEIRLNGKSVELILEIDPLLAGFYLGDDMRLRQILINLAGNASKFTEKGYIKIRVEDFSNSIGEACLKISVIDSGIGIKKEDIGKLFKAFQQVNMKMNRSKGGTGLGLSISKNLVSLMNGSMGVESDYGKGSVFYVNLPQKRMSDKTCGDLYKPLFDAAGVCEDNPRLTQIPLSLLKKEEFAYLFAEKQSVQPFKAPDAKILVVDDSEVNLQVADGLLKKFSINCTRAMSGYEALDLLKQQEFDVVFMDHQMPEMDGIETLEKIRKAESEGNLKAEKNIVIALSANAVNGAKDMFLSKGFDDFVAKPVQGKDFASCLLKWLKKDLIVRQEEEKEVNSESKIKSAPGDEKDGNFVKSENSGADQIPADFPYFSPDVLDVQKACAASGGFENWLALSKTFASSIQDKASLIQDYFLQGKYKDYTIQVHALKSAARIVGFERLSEMAEDLEAGGNAVQDMQKKDEKSTAEKLKALAAALKVKTESLLAYYRSLIELLEPVKFYGETKASEKKDSSDEEIEGIIKELLQACKDFDLVTVENNFAKLKEIKLPADLNKKMDELSMAIENIEFDKIEELLKN